MKGKDYLTDKDRILMQVVQAAYSMWLSQECRGHNLKGSEYQLKFKTEEHIKKDDLVFAVTSQPNDFKIGFFVKWDQYPSSAVIREIGSEKTCVYSNESFVGIMNINEIHLLDGVERQIYIKCRTAIGRADPYDVLFRDIAFKDGTVTLSIRKKWSNDERFSLSFTYSKRTTIKSILALIKKAGGETVE